MPDELETFLDELGRESRAILGTRLVGLYVHGSVAMGSFVPGRSDLDLVMVVDEPLGIADKSELVRLLWRLSPPEDIRGVETHVVVAANLESVELMTCSELFVSRHPGEPVTRDGGEELELFVDLAMLREESLTVIGPPPDDLIVPIDRNLVLSTMVRKMKEKLGDEPESYAVLNAARTLVFEATGKHVSKVDGGTWAIENGHPPGLLRRAIRVQLGLRRDRPLGSDGKRFVLNVIDILDDAISAEKSDSGRRRRR